MHVIPQPLCQISRAFGDKKISEDYLNDVLLPYH